MKIYKKNNYSMVFAPTDSGSIEDFLKFINEDGDNITAEQVVIKEVAGVECYTLATHHLVTNQDIVNAIKKTHPDIKVEIKDSSDQPKSVVENRIIHDDGERYIEVRENEPVGGVDGIVAVLFVGDKMVDGILLSGGKLKANINTAKNYYNSNKDKGEVWFGDYEDGRIFNPAKLPDGMPRLTRILAEDS